MTRSIRVPVVWIFLALVWGSTWAAIKIGLEDLPPLTFAGMRFVLAAAVLIIYLAVSRRESFAPLARNAGFLSFIGLIHMAIPYACVFWVEQYLSSSLTALVYSSMAFMVAGLGHFLLPNEPLTRQTAVAIGAGIVGLYLVLPNAISPATEHPFLPLAVLLVGVFGSALGTVLLRKNSAGLSPAIQASAGMIVAAAVLMPLGLATEPWSAWHFTPRAVASLLYLAFVGTALAFLLFFWLLTRLDATRATFIAIANPVVAAAIGALFLAEPVGMRFAAGLACVAAGILLLNRRPPRAAKLQ